MKDEATDSVESLKSPLEQMVTHILISLGLVHAVFPTLDDVWPPSNRSEEQQPGMYSLSPARSMNVGRQHLTQSSKLDGIAGQTLDTSINHGKSLDDNSEKQTQLF